MLFSPNSPSDAPKSAYPYFKPDIVFILSSSPTKRISLSDRVQKLVPAGDHAHGGLAQRVERNDLEAARVEQPELRLFAADEGREIAAHQARHRDAGTVVAHREHGAIVHAADMRHRIQRHADESRPFERKRYVGQLREDADHGPAQGIEGRFRVLLAEGAAAAKDHA